MSVVVAGMPAGLSQSGKDRRMAQNRLFKRLVMHMFVKMKVIYGLLTLCCSAIFNSSYGCISLKKNDILS